MTEKMLGKIKSVSFGMGGYQEAMLGFNFTFESGSIGIGDFRGTWAERSEGAKWSLQDQAKLFSDAVLWMRDILKAAKKDHLHQLVNVPVELTIVESRLESWRVLTEVI